MPLDAEKKRLEARLLDLLQRALQERNRDDIVVTTLELGALYLSGDLYDRAEECFRRVLEEPVRRLARSEEKAQAEAGLAHVLLVRGHLTLAREALERAERLIPSHGATRLEIRRLQCQRDLHGGQFRDVVDNIEATLQHESAEVLGDGRIDFMILEGRARRLLGRLRQAQRLLEKGLELAESTGYEAGAANARSELGVLFVVLGQFKRAHEHCMEALRSDEGSGSLFRLDRDRCRTGMLLLRMGRWEEAAKLLHESYTSSRDLRTLENRLAAQLAEAELRALRGELDEARDQALDAMEVARAAGFVHLHVLGLLAVAGVGLEAGRAHEALETLHEAEGLYARIAPEGPAMIQIQIALGRAHDALGDPTAAFERFTRAHNLARETGNVYDKLRVDVAMGRHFARTGDEDKAATILSQAAAELGALGAKYDVAMTRLAFAQLLVDSKRARTADELARETKLARSNLFEARRLLETIGATSRLAEVAAVASRLHQLPAASSE
jgi:tetratricopeptide (TPR) repeat protein